MNFGELTEKQKLCLEQRTAFLINLTGVAAQEILGEGISTRKLYKILANTLVDWHWLSNKHYDKFPFLGAGELVWVPHRFGALGLVVPKIEYANITLHLGLFPNILQLFESGEYAKYGAKSIERSSHDRSIIFPKFIALDSSVKSGVEHHERHFWSILVSIYSRLDDAALDALASCRTKTLAVHSLWVQLLLWRSNIVKALNILKQEYIDSIDEITRKEIIGNIETARGCVKHIFTKRDYAENISIHIIKLREQAAQTELAPYLPCIEELGETSLSQKLDTFLYFCEVVNALHDVFREFQKCLGLDSVEKKADLNFLADRLNYLSSNPSGLPEELFNQQRWFTLFLQRSNREVAYLGLLAIEKIFEYFEDRLMLKMHGHLPAHYEMILSDYYPLPLDRFLQGN